LETSAPDRLLETAASLWNNAVMVESLLKRLNEDGWLLLPDVIPSNRVDTVRRNILAARERSLETEEAKLVAGDARVTTRGGAVVGLINLDQSIAPYLADPRVLAIIERLWGDYTRIVSLGGLISDPGHRDRVWHADWPFNQTNAAHIPAPYPDSVQVLTGIFMLTPFTAETGGTFVVPKSHRSSNNPTGDNGVDRVAPHPAEVQVTGEAGSLLLFDSRIWHSAAPVLSRESRVAAVVRYAPWWINLNPILLGTDDHARIVGETNGKPYLVPLVAREVFEALPDTVQPLLRHWVEPGR